MYKRQGGARAARAEWLTGWPALSVGDARAWRGLSGESDARQVGVERSAGLGRARAAVGRRGENEPALGWCGPLGRGVLG